MKKHGFTLIELSLVLVIVGLIIGGIMSGQHLIKTNELRSIFTQLRHYEASRFVFQDRYKCGLPGDCNKATQFNLGTNGNGNGYVNNYSSSLEAVGYWQHLARAGLIEGEYTGAYGPGGALDFVIKGNVPSTKRNGVGVGIFCRMPNPAWNTSLGIPDRQHAFLYSWL